MKRVIVLGSTGSIGVQALEVISSRPDIEVVGLSCARNSDLLLSQAEISGCVDVAIENEDASSIAGERSLSVRLGQGAAARLVREVEADLVLNAIVGFAGLEATLATLETGCPLALANKESLVCAGSLVSGLCKRYGATILPVDSEHSAIFQLVDAAGGLQSVESIVITGSGGPFRGLERSELERVTREQALAHPTWSMGPKISIDSATLMNKGLEVIEAHHLFGLEYERINVALHPQSVVHALVRMVDGALLAHMGMPDMRVPIAYALDYPERGPVDTPRLPLEDGLALDFGRPDEQTFPAIRVARDAGASGDRCTCAMNAANEVAVHSFLASSLGFLDIVEVVAEVVEVAEPGDVGTYDEAVAVDSWARDLAREACARRAG